MRSQFLPSPKLKSHYTHISETEPKEQQNSAINIKYSKQLFQSLKMHLAQTIPNKKIKNPSISQHLRKDPLLDSSPFKPKSYFSSSFNSIKPTTHFSSNSQLISAKSTASNRPSYLEPEVVLNKSPNKHYFQTALKKSHQVQRYEFPFIRSPKNHLLIITKNGPSKYSVQHSLHNKSPYSKLTN